jgi:hypothetical protein
MSGGIESAAQLRVQIIGDPTNLQDSLDAVSAKASSVAGHMTSLFSNVGGIIGSAIAFGGAYALLSKGVDLASQQASLQAQQAVLVKNQGASNASFVGGLSTVLGTQNAINKAGQQYSALLDGQATQMSFQTGIAKNSIIQAQNLLIPNTDLTNLYKSQNAETKKNGDYLNQSLMAAANLSAQMGTSGNIVTGAKALGRVLADPAKAMSSMSRMGFHLSQPMQAQIKLTEKQNGLLAAQQLTIKDINSQLGGTAAAAITPVQRLQNDFNNLAQTLGRGLMPVIDNMAEMLGAALQAAMPLFNAIAQSMTMVSSTIGNALGTMVQSFMPMIKIFTSGFLPALLAVLKPIIGFFSAIGQVLAQVFSSKEIAIFVGLFIKLGAAVAGAILPALNELAGIFKKLEQSGQLTQLLNAFLQVLSAILPVLPTMVTAFAQILQAVMPLIPYFAEIVTIMAKISAKGINMLVTGFDDFIKVITKFKPLFELVGGALLILAAVWFSKRLFQTPMMALVQLSEKMVGGILKSTIRMKSAFKGAFAGISQEGNSAFSGMAMGWRKGMAGAEKDIKQRQLNMMVLTKQINPRSATRLQRMLDVQGPEAEEVYKNARLQTMPLFGKYFAARQRAGESDVAYEARKTQLKQARGIKNYLLGSNLNVQDFMKQAQLPTGGEEGEEEENVTALKGNTGALGELKQSLENSGKVLSGSLSGVGEQLTTLSNSEKQLSLLNESGTALNEKALTPMQQGQLFDPDLTKEQGGLFAKEATKVMGSEISKSSFRSRLSGRFGGTGGGRQLASGVGMAATGAFGAATSFALGGGMGQLSQFGKGISDLFNGKKVDWNGMLTGAMQLSGELGSMAPLVHGLGNMFGGLSAIVKKMFGSEVLDAVAAGTETDAATGSSAATMVGEMQTASTEMSAALKEVAVSGDTTFGQLVASASASGTEIAAAMDTSLGEVDVALGATEVESAGMFAAMIAGMVDFATTAATAIFTTVIPAIVSMGVAIWTAMAPLLPFIAIAVAIGAAIFLIIKYWKDIKRWAVDAWHGIEDAAKVVMGWIEDAWGGIMSAGKTVMGWFVSAWDDVEGAAVSVWDSILGAGKKVWGWLKDAFDWVMRVGATIWDGLYNGFVYVANMIIKAYNATIGNVLGWLGMGGGAKFGYLKYTGGSSSPAGKQTTTTNGAMNVHILSASVAAGKALNGTKTTNAPSTTVNVHPGAFQVNVQGSLDSASMADVKNHVNEQFKQLKYAVRAQGR